ncbi:unnamed protein product, partial [Staurois parvus]
CPPTLTAQSVVHCVPGTQWITDQRKELITSALSCNQLCPITAPREAVIGITQRGHVPVCADDQCSSISATCQCPSMPHIIAHLSCLSVPPISAI